MPSASTINATRAFVVFKIPKNKQNFKAVIDTGAEANVIGMNHLSEGNLLSYMRPYFAELHPIGKSSISCSFKINIPINFHNDPKNYMIDFIVLNSTQHIILGQPWLRDMQLCIDLGYSVKGVNSLQTSRGSKLERFYTDLQLETDNYADGYAISRTNTRFSVPFIKVRFHKDIPTVEAILDTGAMVNIISYKKFKEIAGMVCRPLKENDLVLKCQFVLSIKLCFKYMIFFKIFSRNLFS